MQAKLKLEPVLRLGFGITLSLMLGTGLVAWGTVRKLEEANAWVDHTHTVISHLKSLEKAVVDTETGQRGFLIANQEEFLDPYRNGRMAVEETLEQIRALTADNPVQQANLDALERLVDAELAELEVSIAQQRAGNEEAILERFQAGEGKRKMDAVRSAISMMVREEEALFDMRSADTEIASRLAAWAIFGGTSGAIGIGLLVLLFISREAVRPIDAISSNLDRSSVEIAAAVEEQERNAQNQAAIANQTTTTMDELSASSRQSAEQAEAAASGARDALALSEGGTQAVANTLERMDALREKVAEIAAQIGNLDRQATQIGSISDLVSELANQTNMLALNAAVEAVRAGEHGKGFSVVSSEIRKLADRSKESADRINALVRNIQVAIKTTAIATDDGTQTVEAGVHIAEETSRAFSGVTEAVTNIVLNSKQISLNTQQQATAIRQILTAMTDLNQAARENATGIGQVKEGTHSLKDAAAQLKTIV